MMGFDLRGSLGKDSFYRTHVEQAFAPDPQAGDTAAIGLAFQPLGR